MVSNPYVFEKISAYNSTIDTFIPLNVISAAYNLNNFEIELIIPAGGASCPLNLIISALCDWGV
jgi:hypothetical protein